MNSDAVDCKVSSVQKCVADYLRKESGIEDVIGAIFSDDKEEGHNRQVEEKVFDTTIFEAFILLNKLIIVFKKHERASLTSIIRIKNKKQQLIKEK